MNRVRLLPDHVANQIAAGEVVERPVSVVKELVENALDAQARQIIVEIQAGGRSLIRITDDGTGMSRDDALMALERHATSKIKAAEDLQAITTMGFRGEALPSLASVSRMTLTTRERETNAVEATQVIIHGSKILEVKSAGAPFGTCIEARQLFFNLPARRKFLRSDETERAHIQHYVMLAAMAHPTVAFTFIQDQRTVWQLPAIKAPATGEHPFEALRERLRALLGSGDEFARVDYTAPLPDAASDPDEPAEEPRLLGVWGFIGAPGVSRSNRENQSLFVNRRPVENRGLNFALLEGYHNVLMKGRYPVCCLFLEIHPAEVDVNIHPAKREVKFRHEAAVRQITTQAIRQALLHYHQGQVQAAPATPVAPAPIEPMAGAAQAEPPAPTTAELPFFSGQTQADIEPPRPALAPVSMTPRAQLPETQSVSTGSVPPAASLEAAPAPLASAPPVAPLPVAQPAPALAPAAGPSPLLSVPLRLVGVVGKLYVVFESDRGLVLLDQHAAHERILYEQMLQRLDQGQAPSQRLLLPETIELSPRDAQFTREQTAVLNRLGVGLSEFGERTFLLDALPPFVQPANARRFVLDILDELKEAGREVNSWRLGEHVVASTVCRHAVKAHDPLSPTELEKLLKDLRQCVMPYTCPHGRPTLIEMSYRELEKRFGRVQ